MENFASTSRIERGLARPGKTRLELAFDLQLRGQPATSAEAYEALRSRLMESRVLFGGGELPTSLKPLFVPRAQQKAWASGIGNFLSTLSNIISRHIGDEDFYNTVGFTEIGREMMSIDPGYDDLVITCRPDALVDAESAWLLEVNSDSPAMMTCADFVEREQRDLFPLRDLLDDHGVGACLERTLAMARAQVEAYRQWGGTKSHPTFAIVDWNDEATLQEQELTAGIFREAGYPTVLCDPSELKIENGKLMGGGEVIDIVQRRVLSPDFVYRADELKTLVRAYRERLCCMVNSLRSFLLGQKGVMAWVGGIADRLSAEERAVIAAHLPETKLLIDIGIERAVAEQELWVLKPAIGHGGKDVLIGSEIDAATWRSALESASIRWIVQRKAQPMIYDLPVFSAGDCQLKPYYINWNPFYFGGEFGGAIARASTEAVVNIRAGGALLPVIES